MSLTYTVEPDPSSADTSWVIDRLVAFNESRAGSRNVRNFGIFARDQDGELLAGFLCTCHWNYLFVSRIRGRVPASQGCRAGTALSNREARAAEPI